MGLAATLSASGGMAGLAGRAQAAEAWQTAPFMLGNGSIVTLEQFIGQPVLLNFWATWCIPCRTEMPSLDELQAAFGGHLTVMTLSVDTGGIPQIQDYYAQYELTNLGIFHDNTGAMATAFGITSYPTTYLIDRYGNVAGVYARAFDWSSTVAKATVAAIVQR